MGLSSSKSGNVKTKSIRTLDDGQDSARYVGNSPKDKPDRADIDMFGNHIKKPEKNFATLNSISSSANNSKRQQQITGNQGILKVVPREEISLSKSSREYDQLDSQPIPQTTGKQSKIAESPQAEENHYEAGRNGNRKSKKSKRKSSLDSGREYDQLDSQPNAQPTGKQSRTAKDPQAEENHYEADRIGNKKSKKNKRKSSLHSSGSIGPYDKDMKEEDRHSNVAWSDEHSSYQKQMKGHSNENFEEVDCKVHKLKKKKTSGTRKLLDQKRNTTECNMTTNASDQTVQEIEDNKFDEAKTGNKLIRLENDKRNAEFRIQVMTLKAQRLEKLCKQDDNVTGIDGEKSDVCPAEFITSVRRIENYILDLKKTILTLTVEKNDYLNRLSGFAGAALTNNNPNIANLNDSNRPMKLAEKYNKIYDDEWTDAMEVLEKMVSRSKTDKEMCVYHVYTLLKVIYETLKQKAEVQLQRLTENIFLIKDPSSEQIDGLWKDYKEERQRIIETRKQTAEGVIMLLQSTLKEDSVFNQKLSACDPALRHDMVDKILHGQYFQKCIDICWHFVIQDPPIYLETNSLAGQKLNKDTHKEYTVSGHIINYVVWPALYLHEQIGTKRPPLLAKGVVQPIRNEDSTDAS